MMGEQTIRSGDRVEWVVDGVLIGVGAADDVDMKYAADGWITVLFDGGDGEPTAVPLSQLRRRVTGSSGAAPAFKVGRQVLNRATDQVGVVIEPGTRVAVQYSNDPGVVAAGAEWENPDDLVRLTDALAQAEDSAGPAPSSASTSGTGGLADTAAQLAGNAKDLARLARDAREELEGRRRELWDATVQAARLAEIGCGAGSRSYADGLLYAHHLVTGIGGEELERLLDAELDARYGKDRAKGGEPRG